MLASMILALVFAQAPDGKLACEVASIRASKQPKIPNFDLELGNAIAPGGRLSVGFPLWTYILFAYKLNPTPSQERVILAGLPKWINEDFYLIEARAPGGNAAKDEMRVMMQSLLAERFKLALHFDSPIVPAFALTLVRPGRLGPNLRAHAQGPACPTDVAVDPLARFSESEVFPPVCGGAISWFRAGKAKVGSRNTTMELVANDVQSYGFLSNELEKPVVDGTGLTCTFDYIIEWAGQLAGPRPLGAPPAAPVDPQGPSFLQALRDQLGLKLVATRAKARTLVIDHVERPTEN